MFMRKLSRKLFPDKPASTDNCDFHISATLPLPYQFGK